MNFIGKVTFSRGLRMTSGNSFAHAQKIVRHFGITDTVTKYASDKIIGDKEKKFQEMMQMMLTTPNWSLKIWKITVEKQLGSWALYIPGMKDSTEIKDTQAHKEMLDKMLPSELENYKLIDLAAKERISRASGKTVEEVSRLLTGYCQSLVMQQWLLMKKAAGETLPVDSVDLQRLQEKDIRVRGIAMKIMNMNKKAGRSRSALY